MKRFDDVEVTRGVVESFKAGRGKGTGFGFVQNSEKGGRAFFHINGRIGVEVESYGGADYPASVGQCYTFSSREPKAGDELVIFETERGEKGLKVTSWCFASEWDSAVQKRDAHNAERTRRAESKPRLEADLAQAGWPALSLQKTSYEGIEFLGGRYHTCVVEKKAEMGNSVGAMVVQKVVRDGVEVERRTELPKGILYYSGYSLERPAYLYFERAEAMAELESSVGPFEKWEMKVEFPPRVFYALGAKTEGLTIDVAANTATYRLVHQRFGVKETQVSFSPEKDHTKGSGDPFVLMASLSGFVAPEVEDELAATFSEAARASRHSRAYYETKREGEILQNLKTRDWEGEMPGGRNKYELSPAELVERLLSGEEPRLSYDYREIQFGRGEDQRIIRPTREELDLIHERRETHRRENAWPAQTMTEEQTRKLLEEVLVGRLQRMATEIREQYAAQMAKEIKFSSHYTTPDEWYSEEVSEADAEEFTACLAELKQWFENLQGLEAQIRERRPVLAAEREQARQDEAKNIQEKVAPLREKWDAMIGQGNPEGGYSGKAHHLESYVKEFIRLQYGVEYRNLGNSARRHSVFGECSKIITGNWEALRQARLTESAIAWLKDHEYLWNKDKVLKAFRAEPDFAADLAAIVPQAQLSDVAMKERQAWQGRREQNFWASLAAGSGKAGSLAMTDAASASSTKEASGDAVGESGPSAMALAFAAAQKKEVKKQE